MIYWVFHKKIKERGRINFVRYARFEDLAFQTILQNCYFLFLFFDWQNAKLKHVLFNACNNWMILIYTSAFRCMQTTVNYNVNRTTKVVKYIQ